jgi:hypothetical protein
MKTVIFKAISLQTLGTTTTPAVGFSVPVDASNTYVDFRIGNKVYVKLKISILISTMEVFASEEFMSTLITKVRWGDCHKMTIKMYFMPPVLLWEDVLVRRLTIPDF